MRFAVHQRTRGLHQPVSTHRTYLCFSYFTIKTSSLRTLNFRLAIGASANRLASNTADMSLTWTVQLTEEEAISTVLECSHSNTMNVSAKEATKGALNAEKMR